MATNNNKVKKTRKKKRTQTFNIYDEECLCINNKKDLKLITKRGKG